MKKIIVRKNVTKNTNENYILNFKNNKINSIEQLILHYGMDKIMSVIYQEDFSEYQQILNEYENIKEMQNKKYFDIMYKIDENFAVLISEHIELCKLEKRIIIQNEALVQWDYISGKKYVGDTWWFEDSEILSDIQNLGIIKFYEKYKGF